MQEEDLPRAVAAALATASGLALAASEAIVLSNSNRIAVRLLPCDTLVRVAPEASKDSESFEVEIGRLLAATDGPVALPDPRVAPQVYYRDGFTHTFWEYHEPLPPPRLQPMEYAVALRRLHTAMRLVDRAAPHFTDRVMEAQLIVDDPAMSPTVERADRELLSETLRRTTEVIQRRGRNEQLLHGEPHAGNLLRTDRGLLFIDLQTSCRGPVEFDIAHCSQPQDAIPGAAWLLDVETPANVAAHYPGADPELVRHCWLLMLAMVASWRADHRDQFPDGTRMRDTFLQAIRNHRESFGFANS